MENRVFWYSLTIILVIAAGTYVTRAAPFWLFSGKRVPAKIILYLGGVLAPAVMAMLVVYCLREVSVTVFPFGAPELLAAFFVIFMHLWKRNMLISIFGGTAIYMFFTQVLFIV